MKTPKFGPAGTSESFGVKGYKKMIETPIYLRDMGLDTYEYQAGHGVRISLESAAAFGEECKKHGISLSIHAPYYISMASVDEEKRLNSVNYVLQSARVIHAMGGQRVIIHPGSMGKWTREEAVVLAKNTVERTLDALEREGLSDILMCMETMGKVGQLGDLDEILEFCSLSEQVFPCIDFGHLNARTHGGIKSKDDYADILDKMKEKLGEKRYRNFHAHFSKIEYSKGGEKKHLTFEDQQWGPDPFPLLELVRERDLSPIFICESAGTQAEDAKRMKDYFYGGAK